MLVVGLTGSIAMGKSTTAAMFAACGVPVFDADAAVHQLYAGRAAAAVAAAFPGTLGNGGIDRTRLAAAITEAPARLAELESIVHPLVREEEAGFRVHARVAGTRLVVLDIPLLLELGRAGAVDVVVVATAAPQVQRARLLGRPGMNEAKAASLIARQMPDGEKRRKAHFLVETGRGMEPARRAVADILRALAGAAAAG